ncbi:alpha-amylase family glycosyl hydrolase (plasmid) [Sinorhizobium meliloti]|nr:alpha-amylase family glycosyl hydrolase [Sinorhizobium meliloti]
MSGSRPSSSPPFADNGYDVSDYYSIDPILGTLDDFLDFLHAAGEQGIRVVVDLVANHTSSEHPWFQAARRDARCRFRDYYVWSESPPPVAPDNKTAFPGEESSVWTYDDLAQAYYFHKFRHFQPDLNIANPAVRDELLRVVDYWLTLGVDGFRVDAAPFVIGETGIEHADPRDPPGLSQGNAQAGRREAPGRPSARRSGPGAGKAAVLFRRRKARPSVQLRVVCGFRREPRGAEGRPPSARRFRSCRSRLPIAAGRTSFAISTN